MYATPAQLDAAPMDFSVYMQAQRVGAEVMQNKLQLEAQLLQTDKERSQLGTEAVMGVVSTLDKFKAYGDKDEAQLEQIRTGYRERLQNLVKQGVEGGGLHTIADPLRLESARLERELDKGELGDIGQRHSLSQEHLKIAKDLYSKGNLTNYDMWATTQNLLSTPKKSNDIVKTITDLSTSAGLKNSDINVLKAEYLRAAQTMFPQDFATMDAYDADTGASSKSLMVHSLMNAADIQFANGTAGGNASTVMGGANNAGGGQRHTPMVPTGAGETATRGFWGLTGTPDAVLQTITTDIVSKSLQTDTPKEQHGVISEGDEGLKTMAFAYNELDPKSQSTISKSVFATLSHSSIKSITHSSSMDSGEIVSDLLDEKKYKDFRIVGVFDADNPYQPNGYAATSTNIDSGEQETFIVSLPNSDPYDQMIFDASKALYNNELRAAGHKSEFNINVTDAGLDSTTALYGTGDYEQENATVSGAISLSDPTKSDKHSKYKLYTQARLNNIGGKATWEIVADIINTETGERVDISGDKGYSTLNETIYWLKNVYNDNFY